MKLCPKRISSFISNSFPALAVVFSLIVAPLNAEAANIVEPRYPIPTEVAADFGQLMIQSAQGRIQPVDTYASEILRKIYHKNAYGKLNANQMLLQLVTDPTYWSTVSLIYIGDRGLRDRFGAEGKHAAFSRFFDTSGHYILTREVEAVYGKPPQEQNKTDKELIKLDEKINILYGLFSRQRLPLFPLENGMQWLSAGDQFAGSPATMLLPVTRNLDNLTEALGKGNNSGAKKALQEIRDYQQQNTGKLNINPAKIQAEIRYNRADIFRACFRLYLILGGLCLLTTLSPKQGASNGKENRRNGIGTLMKILSGLIVLTFLWQSFGLGLRWYISERGPWTNAYESMVYVAWVCVLGSLFFIRRMPFITALGTLMAGVILFVSNLNWLDPQITPLVPVLKSPWLMIHVSVITASYGFFGICAGLGITTLIQIMCGKTNPELKIINELCMLIGLVLLTAGIFFGAVWANESWGRYWGWDPKETWALITMLFYALATHSRFIHRLNNEYVFSVLSVVGLGIVLMTFFGVNYLLSGLHSYGHSGGIALTPVWTASTSLLLLMGVAGYKFYRKSKPVKG